MMTPRDRQIADGDVVSSSATKRRNPDPQQPVLGDPVGVRSSVTCTVVAVGEFRPVPAASPREGAAA